MTIVCSKALWPDGVTTEGGTLLPADTPGPGGKKTFYIEYFLCNPALAQPERVIVWNDPERRKVGKWPSYCMVNVGF